MSYNILIVAAHPDDEILGCGGVVARLVSEGYCAYTLVLGKGITARFGSMEGYDNQNEIKELREQMYRANEMIGVRKVYVQDLPDNRFDSIPLLDIVKIIEKIKKKVKPDIIFTHYEKDLNIDHHITYKAILAATRPMQDETVKEIFSFEVLSNTEWNYPLSFSPDTFFDISKTINLKQKAAEEYRSEIKDFPHPRSLKGIELSAKLWGMKTGLKYAEAFKLVRMIR